MVVGREVWRDGRGVMAVGTPGGVFCSGAGAAVGRDPSWRHALAAVLGIRATSHRSGNHWILLLARPLDFGREKG